jgi:hypothetical protein
MSMSSGSTFLRRVLVADAAISGATGVLMMAGAPMLAPALGIPAELLRWAGLSLLPFAALVVHLSRRAHLARGGVGTVIALNAAWVVASVALLVSGQVAPTTLGYAFVIVQAVAVAGLADLQYFGLRKTAAP